MKFLIIGNDKRYDYLARELVSSGHSLIDTAGEAEVVVLPMLACADGVHITGTDLVLEEFLQQVPKGAVVFGGIDREGIINYVKAPSLRVFNAIPTAEGAIALAMENSPRTIWQSNCLVVGSGHIGKYLAGKLRDMGANVTLSMRRDEEAAYAGMCGFQPVKTGEIARVMGEQDIIFNTVPARVLGEEELSQIRSDAVLIEIASTPHGFDIDKAKEMGVQVVVGSSLPGTMSPMTAGKIIAQVLTSLLAER